MLRKTEREKEMKRNTSVKVAKKTQDARSNGGGHNYVIACNNHVHYTIDCVKITHDKHNTKNGVLRVSNVTIS